MESSFLPMLPQGVYARALRGEARQIHSSSRPLRIVTALQRRPDQNRKSVLGYCKETQIKERMKIDAQQESIRHIVSLWPFVRRDMGGLQSLRHCATGNSASTFV